MKPSCVILVALICVGSGCTSITHRQGQEDGFFSAGIYSGVKEDVYLWSPHLGYFGRPPMGILIIDMPFSALVDTILLPVDLTYAACQRKDHANKVITPQGEKTRNAEDDKLSIDAFRFIKASTTIQQVFAKCGLPDRDIGSGIHIYEYRLADGTLIWIGSPDNCRILYIRHGTNSIRGSEILYQPK